MYMVRLKARRRSLQNAHGTLLIHSVTFSRCCKRRTKTKTLLTFSRSILGGTFLRIRADVNDACAAGIRKTAPLTQRKMRMTSQSALAKYGTFLFTFQYENSERNVSADYSALSRASVWLVSVFCLLKIR